MAENGENSNPKKRKILEDEAKEKLVKDSIDLNQKLSEFAKYVKTLESTDIIDHFLEILETQKREIIESSEDLEIHHEVNKDGFAVRVHNGVFRTRDIKGLHHFRLPYHVKISSVTRQKEDPFKTATVDGSANADEQAKWVEATGFDEMVSRHWECVNLKEDELEDITKEWDYGDYDSPIRGLGSVDCSFYFATPSFPDKTRAFVLLNEDGEIASFAVGEFNETENEWKENGVRFVMYK